MRSIAILACALVGLGCGDNRVVHDARPIDAAIDAAVPPDAPRLGVYDAFCTGQGGPRVLVYTYENAWRHLSNYYARSAIYNMCQTRGFSVWVSNDPHVINATQLAQIDVVVFSLTSGSALEDSNKADLEAWVRAGGGIVGLHSASYTEQDWPFYVQNIGAQFKLHVPGLFPANVNIIGSHPITDGLPNPFQWTEEWYVFQSPPEDVPGMQMLFALDESTLPAEYPDMYKVGYHPIGWVHEPDGGRVFYTALGHNEAGFSDPTILEIVGRGIEWAAHRR